MHLQQKLQHRASLQRPYKNFDQIIGLEGVNPHIYGKFETRFNRKMGHVTVINENIDKAKELAKENDIHKGISKYKVKNDLINYSFNSLNEKNERNIGNNPVNDVFEKMD